MKQAPKKRESKIGTSQKPEKKPLINPRYKNLVTTISIIAIIAIFFIVNNSKSEPEQGPYPPNYNKNELAPMFELQSINGNTVKLSDYKGKVVLIDFWATWCPPCRKSIPDLISLKNKYKDKGFEVIGISLDQQNTIKDVAPFAKDYQINYPVVFADQNVWEAYGQIQSIPTSFLINKKGEIAAKHIGYVEISQYQKEIEELLK